MKWNLEQCVVESGTGITLAEYPTAVDPLYHSKKDYEQQLGKLNRRLSKLQELLYASKQWALLVILQGMDASGKDGTVKHVLAGVNPVGFRVVEFKTPTEVEERHEFMWREIRVLPQRGEMVWFNRSWYEEVLIARVHPELLREQGLSSNEKVWKGRYQSIRQFEAHLDRNRTKVLKFLLHISKEEQRRRFLKRLNDPAKLWKMEISDVSERKYWDDYLAAHNEMLRETASADSPWHVIPADDKKNARLMVARMVCQTLEDLAMEFPHVTQGRRNELEEMKRLLK